jgi:predicted MFS family arabinose efflux permease
MNRFTGPGRVGIQSLYLHQPSGSDNAASSNVPNLSAGAAIGGLLGGLLDK